MLVSFVLEEMERLGSAPPAAESVALVSRLHQAVNVLSQSTVEAFVTLYTQTIADQNERLEQFTRMAAHEWRQPLGALRFGVSLLRRTDLDAKTAERALAAVERTLEHLVELTHKLEAVARIHTTRRQRGHSGVSAATIGAGGSPPVREMAEARRGRHSHRATTCRR